MIGESSYYEGPMPASRSACLSIVCRVNGPQTRQWRLPSPSGPYPRLYPAPPFGKKTNIAQRDEMRRERLVRARHQNFYVGDAGRFVIFVACQKSCSPVIAGKKPRMGCKCASKENRHEQGKSSYAYSLRALNHPSVAIMRHIAIHSYTICQRRK